MRLAVGGRAGGSEAGRGYEARRLLLLLYPLVEVGLRYHADRDRHEAVVVAADLRALAEVEALVADVDPALVQAAGDDGLLDAEARNGRAVHGIGCGPDEADGGALGDRHLLVGREQARNFGLLLDP